MKALRWLADHWYIPVIMVVAAVTILIGMKRPKDAMLDLVKRELDAINAKREVREMQIQLGAEAAKQHVNDTYREQLESLDERGKARAEALEKDPAALAKMLEKLSRG